MTKTYVIKFSKRAEKDYEKLKKNKRVLEKIKSLLQSIKVTPDYGIGHPEQLKSFGERQIFSRHVNDKDRLTYEILKDSSGEISFIQILAFKGHYDDH